MLTTCPECRTTFRLSHAQLEARRGLVRCGYCRAVFNAYDTLLPEFEAGVPGSLGHTAAADDGAPAARPDWDIPPPAMPRYVREEKKPARRDEPPEPLETDAPGDTDAFVLRLSDRVGAAPGKGAAEEAEPARPEPAAGTDDILLSDLPSRARIEPPPGPARHYLRVALAALLVVTLLAQVAYFLRGPLVAWRPELRPAMESACRALGCHIPLAADAGAIRIESSSLETDPEQPNRATLRVSFSNRSEVAQQWPYLVLKLTDWQGGAIAQRAFAPADYLRKDQSILNGVAAMSEHEFSLLLNLGGLSASGYEVVAKYP
ncbi:DUF3426 domain-containing protein [Parasulfuritortus cantonensis]|uniref:DUF3426 domain-containing protein n=1 Tax=Parasulfuritortus cantonensis TaxID=2528202 RepID=A0A4R1BGL7_9PROT|nr:DUF3426 domain-containing protein [Parasulfuritortus cantonensis]TCJ16376.1 DUF3426 domain-containing protein [Parasulfuritortus cantonensis]